jgi:hypothetical protein
MVSARAPRTHGEQRNTKISRQPILFLDAGVIDRRQQRRFLLFSRRFNANPWSRDVLANILDVF